MRLSFVVTILGILRPDYTEQGLEAAVARLIACMERDYRPTLEAELEYMGYDVEDIFYTNDTQKLMDGRDSRKFYLTEYYDFYIQGVDANKKIVDRFNTIFLEFEEAVNYVIFWKDDLRSQFKMNKLAIRMTIDVCA